MYSNVRASIALTMSATLWSLRNSSTMLSNWLGVTPLSNVGKLAEMGGTVVSTQSACQVFWSVFPTLIQHATLVMLYTYI